MIYIDCIVNDIFTSKTYILTADGTQDVWLVDCGDVEKVYAKIGDKKVKGVLLTHGHFDHIYGVPALLQKFPDCRICTTAEGFDMLADGKLSLARYYGILVKAFPNNRIICREGDVVPLFDDVYAVVYETPGHHSSCLVFAVGDFLFTGDSYIPGAEVVIELPGSDPELAQQSVERILSLAECKLIMCGHKM